MWILWVIAAIAVIAFLALGIFSQASAGGKLPIYTTSAKNESRITYEIKKQITNRVPADSVIIEALDGCFNKKDPAYGVLKHLLFALVKDGYKIGDYFWNAALPQGPGFLFYIYGKKAERTSRLLESIGTIFVCAGDEDFELNSTPSAKRNERVTPGLCICNKNMRISAHSGATDKNDIPEWLIICADVFAESKYEFSDPDWAGKFSDVLLNNDIHIRRKNTAF